MSFPKGYKATGLNCGIKKEKSDLAVVVSEVPAAAAAVYTTNLFQAAPLQVTKDNLAIEGKAQAIVVNSGVANAAMGKQGVSDSQKVAEALAASYDLPVQYTIVASTGVIGMPLPVDKIVSGIEQSKAKLASLNEGAALASQAIMTTDSVPKNAEAVVKLDGVDVHFWGMCKGAGMIHPNMSTMLGFVLSDAAIDTVLLQKALKDAIGDSFNMISVDGDTSTNDMVAVLANGMANNTVITDEQSEAYQAFANALKQICIDLAKQIVADGEGATRMFEVKVKNALTETDAKTIARAVTSSSLVKAAIYGRDANWGRIACAAGYSGAVFNPDLMDIYVGNLQVAQSGQGLTFDEDKALEILSKDYVEVLIDLHEGDEQAVAWGCDLTHDYVSINADYRS
ncbi:MAG: bifunctional glutamate N-acetyltransferase/amino-acid acetyltransferase ArgJ [Peptococcaceae bacterium]|nr:bifunctional glutamate N-acetyltransferase/amino-acid acetyltransferase ArgJ [Peptococcaceae bacterium]